MLPIIKLPELTELLEYKQECFNHGETPTYDGFKSFRKERDEAGNKPDAKDTPFFKLREQLLKEQKYVCAYCGQKVEVVENENEKPQMKTEHFNPQNDTPENDLGYSNLLACCLGFDNHKGKGHCDSMKGNEPLQYITNPATWENRDSEIFYKVAIQSEEVRIFCQNQEKEAELTGEKIGCLNLNHDVLLRERFTVYKNEVQRKLGKDETAWNTEDVCNLIEFYANSSDGHHKSFKDFILWYLNNWLNKQQIN